MSLEVSMNFKTSDQVTYGINSAVVNLTDFFIVMRDPRNDTSYIVEDPKIIVDLFTPEELKRYHDLSNVSFDTEIITENVIARDKIVKVLGYENLEVDLLRSPAGITSLISLAIFTKSFDYLANSLENFSEHIEGLSKLSVMCGIISYYLNTPYDVVKNYPISEIFKKYAICVKAFPNQVKDLRDTEENG